MQLKIHQFDMKLKYPFAISRHTYYSQPNIIVELQHEGRSGYGEATINPYYNITIDNLKESFDQMSKRLLKYIFTSPDDLFHDFSDFLSFNSFALGALNNASWDLYTKMNRLSISSLIELDKQNPPKTSYTLGIASKEEMVEKMAVFPWPIYKVKLGTHDDLALIQHLRKHTQSVLRVDANCAWTAEETIELSKKLKSLNVEFIEQPLPSKSDDQVLCYKNSELPIIADESCCVEFDVENCANKFDGINIKLLKCGGLSPAIRMIKKARKLGLKLMVGCMTETTVGIAAATQLLPYVDYADLDGPLLLAEDLAEGLSFSNGIVGVSSENGLGIVFKGKN